MDKSLQVAGWSAVSFLIGMGAQLTGAPNFLIGVAFYALAGIGLFLAIFNSLQGRLPTITRIILAVLATSTYAGLVYYAISASERPSHLEVTARFVGRMPPHIILINKSDRTASNIKWTAALFSLTDACEIVGRERDDIIQPLQIPVQLFDFLKAHQESARTDIFQGRVTSVKVGDRIFGSISVNCPECGRGHTFIYYVAIGQSGWVWEDKTMESGNIYVPSNGTASSIVGFYNHFESSIPQDERTSIYER